jgi:alkylation response protein AidB-like acyl-CoA dehydrogenase
MYVPRLHEMRFQLWDVRGFDVHYAGLAGEPLPRDVADAMLEEMARFTAEVLAPLNAVGDREGCRFDAGAVHTPPGFVDAYRQFVAAGFTSMVGDAAHGGQGLPVSVRMLLEEMTMGANMAFGMYPSLSRGAASAIEAHGSDAQKATFLRPLLAGRWSGTMCLTEPQAGSDVGLLRTRAQRDAAGRYTIHGTKIFISAGEHDLTENIVHLVLARLPDAPAGTKGISLFIVPKFLPDAAGGAGVRNAVHCRRIEEKMGIHGSATCELEFAGATGFLLGAENAGMRAMFTMMNMARVVVGIQGLGLLEAAFQRAVAYARERRQMRALGGGEPGVAADRIVAHADVRRMLLTQKALLEGGRALVYWTGQLEDLAHGAPDAATRARSSRLADLLTPIVKGFLTEAAVEGTGHAVQVLGGHGYVRDNGVEQFARDARITTIYEGTTQIQALDLLGRKVAMAGGGAAGELVAHARARIDAATGEAARSLAAPARAAFARLADLTRDVLAVAVPAPNEVAAAAHDYLMCAGYTLLALAWLEQADAAEARLRDGAADASFLEGKVATARFYFARLLPRAELHATCARAGAGALMSCAEDALA